MSKRSIIYLFACVNCQCDGSPLTCNQFSAIIKK